MCEHEDGIVFYQVAKEMRRQFILLFSGILMGTLCTHDASAQFWRRRSRREKQRHEYVKPQVKTTKAEKTKKKRELKYPATVRKERYRIDVFLPLFLDELVKDNKPGFKGRIPDRAQPGISAYEGLSLAADTLRRLHYNADIYIHDANAADFSIQNFISTDSLRKTDLIIGAVTTQQLEPLAQYAKKRQINFISIYTPSDGGIRDNPYCTLLNPTLQTHCEFIASTVKHRHGNDNIILCYRSNVAVDSSAFHFTTAAESFRHTVLVDCDTLPDSAALVQVFDASVTNTIVMPVVDWSYAEKIIKDLDSKFPDYRFEIFGMPSWKAYTLQRKTQAYKNIAINISSPFSFDSSVSAGKMLAGMFRNRFGGGSPGEYVYRGFEALYWYTDLLTKYGTIFNEKLSDNAMAIFTPYKVVAKWDDKNNFYYYENKHLYMFRFLGGNVSVEE